MWPLGLCLKIKKAHHLVTWRSGLILVSSFMEAPSIKYPFFVLQLSFLGFDNFYLFNPKGRESQEKNGVGEKGKERKGPDP
jgi:hypothetical protein